MGLKAFKVVIAGGSVAGLALANILENLGIDFIVLEACPEIASHAGASIGLVPNGLRILDQVGCYPAIRELIGENINVSYLCGPDGKQLGKFDHVFEHLRQRHGYPILFFDRQMLLQVLYDNLKDKSKVKASKKVIKASILDSKVEVRTEDGETFVGDILVGADGIRSTIREEMWRIADVMEPGYIPQSEHTAMPCDYKCIFGISVMEEFASHSTHTIIGDRFSWLIITGPGCRVYWFLFASLDKTYYGDDIPRFNKDDEEELVKEHWNDTINKTVKFGDLYARRTSSVLTALPEYVFKKWHFKRIITIGDAAHKLEPLTGQGGNSAIETAAALANELTQMLKKHPESPSDTEIEKAFTETQETRWKRVWGLVRSSHQFQRLQATETFLPMILAEKYMANTSLEDQIDFWTTPVLSATRIEALELPKRFHFVPFEDELPSKPLSSTWFPRTGTVAALLIILYAAQNSLVLDLEGVSRSFGGTPLEEVYTGSEAIDSILTTLVVAFSGVTGANTTMMIQQAYFLVMLMPTLFCWTVEAYRAGNLRSPTALPVVFGVAYQLLGIGKIAPLYFLISVYTTTTPVLARTSGRPISPSIAKALIAALCIGFVIPTVLMFVPFPDMALRQSLVALWQPCPVYVATLTWTIGYALDSLRKSPPSTFDMYDQKDLAPLQAGYTFVFLNTAVMHICTVLYVAATSSFSIASILWTALSLPAALGPTEPTTALAWFWQNDMLLYFASVIVWCFYSVYEMRRLGYVQTYQAKRAALAVIVGQILVGPGATYAGVSYWRETVIAQQVKKEG